MSRYVPSEALLPRVEAGEPAAIGRLISRAEAGVPEARETLARIYRSAGRAHVIGITGVPGSGKSTLVAKLGQMLREQGKKVGIVAVDPSSPFSGGSILGDRIRMTDLALDPGVYIRSMATRGAMGGMARAALDAVDILDVAGFGTIIIETVGVGQDEVEIARASHTTVVVSAPGLGDEIQAIKAGDSRDRRHSCRVEMRPQRCQSDAHGPEGNAHARHHWRCRVGMDHTGHWGKLAHR
jgi:LAO/AO transport system kinase